MIKAIGTRNIFSATSVDQLPKQISCALMFGSGLSLPIPDIDRTDYMLILGANPLASNGSLMTAPDFRGRLKAIRDRGGRIVVIDPRRTRTAEVADEHHPIRPGRDAHFLAGIVHTMIDEGLVDLAGDWSANVAGAEHLGEAVAPFAPEAVAAACGIPAEDIRRIAREIAAAPTAAVYARIGTTTQEFGTLAATRQARPGTGRPRGWAAIRPVRRTRTPRIAVSARPFSGTVSPSTTSNTLRQ